MAKGIVIAGNIVVDTIKKIDSYPSTGMLCSILSVSRTTGGSVPNMGIDLKRMDPELNVLGVGLVGSDANGEYALDAMVTSGMDVSRIQRLPDEITAFTDVMTDSGTNERTFFHARGANAKFGLEHIHFNSLKDCSIFHIAYALLLDTMDSPDAEYGTVMAKVLYEASRRGMVTSMDVVSEQGDRFARIVTPSLKHCDYLIVNEIESSRICGIPSRDGSGKIISANIGPICSALLNMGVRRLVAVHAPEGGWCMEKDGKLTFRPSLKLPDGFIKGTVGAGDAFCAGMLYALNAGWSIEKALDTGSAAAACVLGNQGGLGVRSMDEIEKMLSVMPRRDAL
jgi:sugar/nucleoside kinase (ribokinase family)